MPRAKLEPLQEYRWQSRHVVRVTDVNYGGHLGYDALVGLLHQARVELLGELGLDEKDLGDGCTGVIMTDLTLTVQAEGFLGDELTIRSTIVEMGRATFRVCAEVRIGDRRVALSEAGFAGFNYTERKPSPLPETFRSKVA